MYYLVNRCGRKPSLLLCALGSGLASIAYEYIPTEMSVFRLCDALSGRMFAVGIYYVALQFSLEVLPTVVRGTGAAMCEIFGGLGVFMCPQIVYLVNEGAFIGLIYHTC